jgi:hypothetical protein
LQVYQVLSWQGAVINFSGHFTAGIQQPMAIGFLGSETNRLGREKDAMGQAARQL